MQVLERVQALEREEGYGNGESVWSNLFELLEEYSKKFAVALSLVAPAAAPAAPLAMPSVVHAIGVVPTEEVTRDKVDVMEVNHFYDENGRLVFDQMVFYDWCDTEDRHQVRAWRLIKNPEQVPMRNWQKGGYEALWNDGDVLRKVFAASMRETWTQEDPELLERQFLPTEKRKELHRRAPKPASETPAQSPAQTPAHTPAQPPVQLHGPIR